MRALIVDDERPARGFLISMLKSCPDVTIVGEAADGVEAMSLIEEVRPDVLLLDLQMPGIDGRDLVARLPPKNRACVIFVTAHDDYAVRAFDLDAVDYLTKPVTLPRLREALDRARDRLTERVADESGLEVATPAGVEGDRLRRIPVRHRGDYLLVPVARVVSIIAERELLHITTDQRERFTITYRLKDLEEQLDASQFVRLSRSALVNVHWIARVIPRPGGVHTVVLRDGQEIAMSRMQSRVLRAQLLRL